jgi:hypothetical protein
MGSLGTRVLPHPQLNLFYPNVGYYITGTWLWRCLELLGRCHVAVVPCPQWDELGGVSRSYWGRIWNTYISDICLILWNTLMKYVWVWNWRNFVQQSICGSQFLLMQYHEIPLVSSCVQNWNYQKWRQHDNPLGGSADLGNLHNSSMLRWIRNAFFPWYGTQMVHQKIYHGSGTISIHVGSFPI